MPDGSYTLQSLATDEAGEHDLQHGRRHHRRQHAADDVRARAGGRRGPQGHRCWPRRQRIGQRLGDERAVRDHRRVVQQVGDRHRDVDGFGYAYAWNTTTVPDGSYTLQSLATDEAGNTTYSSGDLDHRRQHAADDVRGRAGDRRDPSRARRATLDASASDNVSVKSVQFVITGGSYNKTVIGTATSTAYG